LSIALGLAHILLGLVLGFINHLRAGERWSAAGKIGWIGVELALVLFVLAYIFQTIEPISYLLAGLGIFSLALVVRAEGITGIMEIPTLASNILSYARILAIGVSSLAIAEVINSLLMPSAQDGWLILLKLPIFVAGHILNLVLGMFESLIQSARLNYVEFFSKFFAGGGHKFTPFALKEGLAK
jgi:V/A-type H+-transporting ATPase subunit I